MKRERRSEARREGWGGVEWSGVERREWCERVEQREWCERVEECVREQPKEQSKGRVEGRNAGEEVQGYMIWVERSRARGVWRGYEAG